MVSKTKPPETKILAAFLCPELFLSVISDYSNSEMATSQKYCEVSRQYKQII